MIKTKVMHIPVIPALKQENVRFQARLHREILSPKEMGARETNKEGREMKVAPSPVFPRGSPTPSLDSLSIYPSLGVTNAFLGLNSSLIGSF